MQTTTRKVQTAFRLDTGLLNRMKRKARARGQSLNNYVESVLMKESPMEPELPRISFPLEKSELTQALHLAGGLNFTEEELATDDRLRHILGLDND